MILLKKRHKKLISKRLYTNISKDELNEFKSLIINDLSKGTSKSKNQVKNELERLIDIVNNKIRNDNTTDKNLKNKKYSDQESNPMNEDESLSDSIFTVLRGMVVVALSGFIMSIGVAGLVMSIKNGKANIFLAIFVLLVTGAMGIASGNVGLSEIYSGIKNIANKLRLTQKVEQYIRTIRDTFRSNKTQKEKQEVLEKIFTELKNNIDQKPELVEEAINNPAVA